MTVASESPDLELAIILHLNSNPASAAIIFVLALLLPAIRAGETQEISTLTTFSQTPVLQVSVLPGVPSPCIVGATTSIGAKRFTVFANKSTALIPERISFSK